MATTGKEGSALEYEEYIEQHGIQAVLKEAVAKLCQERPANPYRYLRDYFESLDKVGIVWYDLNCVLFCL